MCALWILAWASAFGHLYGWYTDDVDIFRRLVDAPPSGLVDPIFFHAYYWFIGIPMNALGLHVASHPVPLLEGSKTAIFRGEIACTIALHALLIVEAAALCAIVLGGGPTALVALVLFVVSPTLTFYTPLLDSRYLGLLAALPAMMLLLSAARRDVRLRTFPAIAFASGLLLSVGQDIHYTTAYLALPFCASFFALLGLRLKWNRVWFASVLMLVAGAATYWGFVEAVHHAVEGVGRDPIAALFVQRTKHLSPDGLLMNVADYGSMFVSQMGLPMIVATATGLGLALARPGLLQAHFNATTIATTAVVGTSVLLVSPTMPFYRQFSGLGLTFAILSAIAIERALRLPSATRVVAFVVCWLAVAFVPAARSAEVYRAHQGFGRALDVAAAIAPPARTWFALEKYRAEPGALRDFGIAGSRLRALPADALLVTDFPKLAGDPYMLAVLHATVPIAAFPTEWCTREQYAELAVYVRFERFRDERERCEARVYSVAALQQTMGTAFARVRMTADSQIGPRYGPERAIDPSQPLWVSAASLQPHHLDLAFDRAALVGAVTIVSPDPTFGGGRIDRLSLLTSASAAGPLHEVWHGAGLGGSAVFSVALTPRPLRRMRLAIVAQNAMEPPVYGGVKQLILPGLRLRAIP